MIEKLNVAYIQVESDGNAKLELSNKINELVDAVNELQENQNTYWTDIAEIKKELQTRAENVQLDAESRSENVQDTFAKQRKWIGKLCKFWDIDNDYLYYGPLTKIGDTGPYYYECNHRICYAHCEPVKDDIIYKGGDNESK